MAGLLDAILGDSETKDEYGQTQAERRQPIWSGLLKTGAMLLAGGQNLMPADRAKYIGEAGGALADIPAQQLAQRSELAKQALTGQQIRASQAQVGLTQQEIEKNRIANQQSQAYQAMINDPAFMQRIAGGDKAARQALAQAALAGGHTDVAAKLLIDESKIIPIPGVGLYNKDTDEVYDNYTGTWSKAQRGTTPTPSQTPTPTTPSPTPTPTPTPPTPTPPTPTPTPPPNQTAPTVPPTVQPQVPTVPPVVPPVVPPTAAAPTGPPQAPLPSMTGPGGPRVGGPISSMSLPLPPRPLTTLPSFQPGQGAGVPSGSLAPQVPGVGMSIPPPPPPPSLLPTPPVVPNAGVGQPQPQPQPPVVPAAVPPTAAAQAPPVVTPPAPVIPQGSNEGPTPVPSQQQQEQQQKALDELRNKPLSPADARDLGGQLPPPPKVIDPATGKPVGMPLPPNPNINMARLAQVPEKARGKVLALVDGRMSFADLRGDKDRGRIIGDAMAVDPSLNNWTNSSRNTWMKQLSLSGPGTPGGLIQNANTYVLHAGEFEDAADKLGLSNDFKANLKNPSIVAQLRLNRDPRIAAYDAIVNPVLREFTNVIAGGHITNDEVDTYKNALYAAQTPQERHAILATMNKLMQDRLLETVAQRHEQIMGAPAAPNQFLFPKQQATITRIQGLADKDAADRAAQAQQTAPTSPRRGAPTAAPTAPVKKFNWDTGKVE